MNELDIAKLVCLGAAMVFLLLLSFLTIVEENGG
jgi:hypothetical protein